MEELEGTRRYCPNLRTLSVPCYSTGDLIRNLERSRSDKLVKEGLGVVDAHFRSRWPCLEKFTVEFSKYTRGSSFTKGEMKELGWEFSAYAET